MDENTRDPGYHVDNIRRMLGEAEEHARRDAGLVEEPRAKALFETTAEVLGGLAKAYEHYREGAEAAWQR